ncbi:MAG: short chain dehydrogenase [Pseudonocardiales bacterium]|nr:short chain dehydrogenase [Pseudonocardiales bacterium]
MQWLEHEIIGSDGLRLAVFTAGPLTEGSPADDSRPTILFVHGYPDDHRVWDNLADELAGESAGQFALISYDVRGAGASAVPADRTGYRVEQLAADVASVAATATGPVHLVAHDWGSCQSWAAVAADGASERFASFTSMSGPDLSMAAGWFKRTLKASRRKGLKQVASSWYLQFFRLPLLPELMWRSGLGFRSSGRPDTAAGRRNAVHGLDLYRANLGRRTTSARPRRCEVPTLVIAPRFDRYVGVALQTEAPARFTTSLRTEIVDGGHWVVEQHPERIAGLIAEFVGGAG